MENQNKEENLHPNTQAILKKLNLKYVKKEPPTPSQPDEAYDPGEPLKPAHEIFVRELLSHGNRRIAYQEAYPGVGNASAYTSSGRLLKNQAIVARIMHELLNIKNITTQVIREHYNGKVADLEEKRAVLAQIIRGELVTEKEITKKGETQTQKYKTDPKERIRAIIVDTKLEEELHKTLIIPDKGMRYIE